MYNIATATAAVVTEDNTGSRMPILPLWGELIFGIITFLILLFLVQRFVVPKLEQAYAERTTAIKGGMAQAEVAQNEAQEVKQQYERQLAAVRVEVAKIRDNACAQGAQIIAEMREQANAESTRIIESAYKQIEVECQQAQVELRSHVGQLSIDLASKIVGESLHDDARQCGIVERFLAELESGNVKSEKVGSSAPGAGA